MTDDPISVVTIGGGHGQAVVLRALMQLRCQITAVVSVADDGGCSGALRRRFGVPPPGDLRRCLTTLATNRELAAQFECREQDQNGLPRALGNLAIFETMMRTGSLQSAVDWAARLLGCCGNVVPAAESPAQLSVYDQMAGPLEGESAVEKHSQRLMAATVVAPTGANPRAREAIKAASAICLGPGSFITSTLASVMMADIAQDVVDAQAVRLLIHNLREERGQTDGFGARRYVALLRDHLEIHTGRGDFSLLALRHRGPDDPPSTVRFDPWTEVCEGQLVEPSAPDVHSPSRLADVLSQILSLPSDGTPASVPPAVPAEEAAAIFKTRVAAAWRRIRKA